MRRRDGLAASDTRAEPQSVCVALNMLHLMYLWMPAIIAALIIFLLTRLKVEQANTKLRQEMAVVN